MAVKRLVLLGLLLIVVASFTSPVQGSFAAPGSLHGDPGDLGQLVRTCLFSTREALAAGDEAVATSSFSDCATSISALAGSFATDPDVASEIQTSVNAATNAVANNDEIAFAIAKGEIWTAVLHGSYAEAVAAATAGRPDDAAAWLMLREFRPTTKFARPDVNATLAVQSLRDGEMSPDDAAATIRADLLDTYQYQLSEQLAVLQDTTTAEFPLVQLEACGRAVGYWSILADSYEQQMGAERRTASDTAMQELEADVRKSDSAALATAVTRVTGIMQSFRAAPLSPSEQSRRAGQLVRYL